MKKFNKLQKPGKVLMVLANLKFSLSGFLFIKSSLQKFISNFISKFISQSTNESLMNDFLRIFTKTKSPKTKLFWAFSELET